METVWNHRQKPRGTQDSSHSGVGFALAQSSVNGPGSVTCPCFSASCEGGQPTRDFRQHYRIVRFSNWSRRLAVRTMSLCHENQVIRLCLIPRQASMLLLKSVLVELQLLEEAGNTDEARRGGYPSTVVRPVGYLRVE